MEQRILLWKESTRTEMHMKWDKNRTKQAKFRTKEVKKT